MVHRTSAFLISMVIMASLSSFSQALTIDGLQINAVHVMGVLHCSLSGDPNAPPLSGITVRLTCDGSSTYIAQGVTNQAGAVDITTPLLGITNFDPQRCFLTSSLPIASCSVFPLSGVLTASLSLVQVIKSTLGNVACVVVTGPIRIG